MKILRIGIFSGPHLHVFRLNSKIYSVNCCNQSKYRKLQARKNPAFEQFSSTGICWLILDKFRKLLFASALKNCTGKFERLIGRHPSQITFFVKVQVFHLNCIDLSHMVSEWLFKTSLVNCFNKLRFLRAVPARSTMNIMLIILIDFYV